MNIIHTVKDLRQHLSFYRKQESTISLVPTMGNLHPGHLSLVQSAKDISDCVVVSIFVNPLQFGPQEDYQRYPRTLENDVELLKALNTHVVFVPSVEELYTSYDDTAIVNIPTLSNDLCGVSRPHLFGGVTTVVTKLLNSVQPNIAVFGEKDFQQLVIIRKMVCDLCFPVKIMGMPIVRETDGLAMSSRNQYLTLHERKIAPLLYETLFSIRKKVMNGRRNFDELIENAKGTLISHAFNIDYISIRNRKNLMPAIEQENELVILAAAWLGKTRLIDNVFVDV